MKSPLELDLWHFGLFHLSSMFFYFWPMPFLVFSSPFWLIFQNCPWESFFLPVVPLFLALRVFLLCLRVLCFSLLFHFLISRFLHLSFSLFSFLFFSSPWPLFPSISSGSFSFFYLISLTFLVCLLNREDRRQRGRDGRCSLGRRRCGQSKGVDRRQ